MKINVYNSSDSSSKCSSKFLLLLNLRPILTILNWYYLYQHSKGYKFFAPIDT